jgi:hypothetical protein
MAPTPQIKIEGALLVDLIKGVVLQPFCKKGWVELLSEKRLPHLSALPNEHVECARQKFYYIKSLSREKLEKLCSDHNVRVPAATLGM